MRRPEPTTGFTLLEVMAAVAVLGVLYTVLAGIALQGLRSEGETERRLDASLLADRQLSDVELQLDEGVAPSVGVTESDDEDFHVSVEVAPFDLAGAQGVEPLPGAATAPVAPGEASELLAVRVVVSWLEGEEEQSLVRTTYAFDADAIQSAAVPAPGQSPPAGQPAPGSEAGTSR